MKSVDDLLEQAWGVIANASEGRWDAQSPDWQDAATRWRDEWHEHLGIGPGGPPPYRQEHASCPSCGFMLWAHTENDMRGCLRDLAAKREEESAS